MSQISAVRVVSTKAGRLGSDSESFEGITIMQDEQRVFAKEQDGAAKGVWFLKRRIIK